MRSLCSSRLRSNEKCWLDQLLLGQNLLKIVLNRETFLNCRPPLFMYPCPPKIPHACSPHKRIGDVGIKNSKRKKLKIKHKKTKNQEFLSPNSEIRQLPKSVYQIQDNMFKNRAKLSENSIICLKLKEKL